jgi:hypothetical protein
MNNSLARQAKTFTWPPSFDVLQPIKRRLRRTTHRQLEENIKKMTDAEENLTHQVFL